MQRVPSATMLAGIRAAEPIVSPSGSALVVLAGTRDAQGNTLAGVRSELHGLERYGAEQARGAAAAEVWLAADVLHVAAHASVSDDAPWRSRILLDGLAGSASDTLDAARIAGTPLSARLAVLASCETAGGRILSGEGVQGLGSAFLAAGVPAVVATLWPVDDQATARFCRFFYAALAEGQPPIEALAQARRGLSSSVAWSDPYYWAGFVLLGDGTRDVTLAQRP